MKKMLSKTRISVALSIFFFSFIFLSQFSLAWYSGYSDWQYRKQINIMEQSGNTLTDYQVAINLTYDSDMQPDFDDLRFTWLNETSGNEQEIPYWIESKSDSNWAYVWIKVPEIPANGNATVYVYYGNPSATSESNGTAVFVIYDKMNEDTWTKEYNGYTAKFSTSNYISSPSAYELEVGTRDSFLASYYARIKKSLSAGNYYVSFKWKGTGSTGSTYHNFLLKNSTTVFYSYNSPTTAGQTDVKDVNFNCSNDYIIFELETTNDWSGDTYDFGSVVVDDVIVRKFADPEPTYSIGSEETANQPPEINITSPTNTTYWTTNIQLNFSVKDDSIYTTSGGSVMDGLVAGWHFDEDYGTSFNDFSLNSNDGTFNGETFNNGTIYGASWVNGKYGKALSFDGVDDYVEVSDSDSLNITNEITLSAWIKLNTVDKQYQIIITKRNTNVLNRANYEIHVRDYTHLAFAFYSDKWNIWKTEDLNLQPDTWYHVVATYKNGATPKIYLNGVSVSGSWVFGGAGNLTPNPNPVLIGDESTTPTNPFNGTIDEVMIFNRALSDSEIQQIYENNTFIRDGLVAYWRFDEGSGNTAYDTHHIAYEDNQDGTKYLNALSFDGVDDYVEVPDDDSLDITDEITICSWVKFENADNLQVLIFKSDWGSKVSFALEYRGNTDDKFRFYMSPDWSNWYDALSSSAYSSTNVWYFVCGVFDGNNMKVSVDGGSFSVGDSATSLPVSAGNVKIGIRTDGNYPWNGTIDEVRIYDRALSESEIQKLYNMQLRKYHVKAYFDGNLIYENASYQNNTLVSLNISSNITTDGLHYVKVWANDTEETDAQTNEQTIYFTVEDYEIEQIIYDSPVYETSSQNYTEIIRVNWWLIDNITANFYYDSTNKGSQTTWQSNSTHITLKKQMNVPLIQTNNTVFAFYFENNVSYSNGTSKLVNSSSNNQNVYYAYYNPQLDVKSSYLEGDLFSPVLTFVAQLQNADINASYLYNGSTYYFTKFNYTYYYHLQYLGGINVLSQDFHINASINISFENNSRIMWSNDTITIYKFTLTDVCSGNETALILTGYDENNLTLLPENITIEITFFAWNNDIAHDYSFSLTGDNNYSICIYPNFAEFSVNSTIQYKSTNYPQRTYYLLNATVNNQTNTINLYLLHSSYADLVTFEVRDAYNNYVENAYVKVLRYYPSTNSYKTVAIYKTDVNGKSPGYLDLYDVFYKFIVEKNFEVGLETDASLISSSTIILTFNPTEIIEYYIYKNNVAVNCGVSGSVITCTWSDLSGYMKKACLEVYQVGVLKNYLLNKTCEESSAGTIGVDLGNISGKTIRYVFYGYFSFNPMSYIEFESGFIESVSQSIFQTGGVLLTFLITISLTSLSLIDPRIAIISSLFGLGISYIFGIFSLSVSSIISLILIGLIVIWRMKE